MKPYNTPVLLDYGSISETTFATPAVGGDPNETRYGTSEPFSCAGNAGTFSTGGKSQQVLLCDKFGEYSHASTTNTASS